MRTRPAVKLRAWRFSVPPKGSLAGYALDDPRVAEALTMLWRLPLAVDDIEMSWLDPASMLAAFRADGLDRVLVIDAPVRGIALFSRGGLVAVYSETQRSAVASPERLRSLLSQARGRLTVMERKPRPVAAGAAPTIPSAVDFFSVVADPEPAIADEAAAAEDEAKPAVAEPEAHDVAVGAPATAWSHPFLREHPLIPVDQDAELAAAAQPEVEDVAASHEAAASEPGADSVSEAAAGMEPAAETAETPVEVAEPAASGDEAAAATAADTPELVAAYPAPDSDAPPPPPTGESAASVTDHEPPPPAPEAATEPPRKGKRPWWAFGTRRRSSTQAPSEADKAAAEAAAAREVAEAAAAAGWGVRQPDAAAPPPWARPRDYTLGDPEDALATEAPPPPAAADVETTPQETTPAWSVVERGSAAPSHEPVAATTESTSEPFERGAPDTEPGDEAEAGAPTTAGLDAAETATASGPAHGEVEATVEEPVAETTSTEEPAAHEALSTDEDAGAGEEPASAAAPAWSAREVIANSVSWYRPPQHVEESSDASADTGHDAAASDAGDTVDAEHEPAAAGSEEHEPVGETAHDWVSEAADEAGADTEHDVAAETADEPAAEAAHDDAGVEHDHDDAEHVEPVAAAHTDAGAAHDFWAEFATPDPHATAEDADQEPEPLTASDAMAEPHADTEEDSIAASEPAAEPGHEPVAAEDAEPVKRKPSERTFAPWNWPLAEADARVAPVAPGASRPASIVDETTEHADDASTAGSSPHEAEHDAGTEAEQGFFQRDEPVGSQFVDFDEVRKELVQIGVMWLGERNAVPVTALLTKTRSTIDDFVATIDTIRGLHVEGQDPASIQAMAREMHQQAAERLCGA